jgi:hypothetical protein
MGVPVVPRCSRDVLAPDVLGKQRRQDPNRDTSHGPSNATQCSRLNLARLTGVQYVRFVRCRWARCLSGSPSSGSRSEAPTLKIGSDQKRTTHRGMPGGRARSSATFRRGAALLPYYFHRFGPQISQMILARHSRNQNARLELGKLLRENARSLRTLYWIATQMGKKT